MTATAKIKPLPASTRTVTIMCKVPNGLVLQLQRKVNRFEDTRDGPVARTYNAFYGKRYWINGPAYPVGTLPKGYPRPPVTEGGYAATSGIPADFWEQWLEQNKNAPYVIPPDGADKGMVYAEPDLESAISAAREHEKVLSGLEPISTDEDKDGKLTDPRLPKPLSASLSKIGREQHPNG